MLTRSGFPLSAMDLTVPNPFSRPELLRSYEAMAARGDNLSDGELMDLVKVLYPEFYPKDLVWMLELESRYPALAKRLWSVFFTSFGGLRILSTAKIPAPIIRAKFSDFVNSDAFKMESLATDFRKNYPAYNPEAKRLFLELFHQWPTDHQSAQMYAKELRKISSANPDFVYLLGANGFRKALKALALIRNGGSLWELTIGAMISADRLAFREYLPLLLGELEKFFPLLLNKRYNYKDYAKIYLLLLNSYPNEKSLASYGLLKNISVVLGTLNVNLKGGPQLMRDMLNALVFNLADDLGVFRNQILEQFAGTVTGDITLALLKRDVIPKDLITEAMLIDIRSYEHKTWFAQQLLENPNKYFDLLTYNVLTHHKRFGYLGKDLYLELKRRLRLRKRADMAHCCAAKLARLTAAS